MKRLLLVSVTLALLMSVVLGAAVEAKGSRLAFQGVYYNIDALPNENAIWCDYASQKDLSIAKGNDFVLEAEQTITDLEDAIRDRVSGMFWIEEWLNYDNEDPEWRYFLEPPVLLDNEEIMQVKPKKVLLRIYLVYFDIHIYSLDNAETPENELRFTTRFSNNPITGVWW